MKTFLTDLYALEIANYNDGSNQIFATDFSFTREELINKLRKEMKKGVDKEYMLEEEDRVLIYSFFNKLIT